MKLTILLCVTAFACSGIEAGCSGRSKNGASMHTTYIGKLHETSPCGEEKCIGTFSGSSNFEQPADCCWTSFAEKCKELIGGLINVLSSSTSCGPCGHGRTSIDLDMKSRISKEPSKPHCETVTKTIQQPVVVRQPVYKQVVYKPTEQCDDCEPPKQHIQPATVVVPQPVYQPVQPIVEQVRILPVKESCDDCDNHKHHHKKEECDDCEEKKHKHHKHRHHKHKSHKKDQCEDDCD